MRIYNVLKYSTQGVNEHEMQLDGAYADLKKWTEDTNIWCEHGEPCVVGDLYNEQSRPFYRPKTALGSPKETFSDISQKQRQYLQPLVDISALSLL